MKFRADWLPALDACLEGAEDWYHVEHCFQSHVSDGEIEDGRPVVYAFGYMLIEASREERRDRLGVFAPRIVWNKDASFPAPLGDIDDAMLGVWEEYAEALSANAIATSRLGDLLWVRRFGEPPVAHARRAADAYLELSDSWTDMNRVACISRALEISTEINDAERRGQAVSRAIIEIESELKVDEWRPGITLRLLERLIALRRAERPEGLADLLAAAAERYSADPFIAQSVSELQAKLAPPQERSQLARKQVERWLAEASQARGLLRYAHLQHALGLARTHSLPDLVNTVLGDLQGMSVDDLDLKRISSQIEIPADQMEAEVSRIADSAASWEDALTRFGLDGPPSGLAEPNKTLVYDLAQRHPLTVLIPRMVLGPYGSLVFEAKEPDEHRRVQLAQQEAMSIRIWSLSATRKVARIIERFGTPTREELGAFFTTELIDTEVAARLADSLLRYLDGDHEAALHILVPQLEAAIRGIAARANVPVIKNPEGDRPGGVIALGGLLSSLKGRMDESWRRYLLNALAEPLGINLRNTVAHGLHGPVSELHVVIAVHVACHLRLLEAAQRGEERPTGS